MGVLCCLDDVVKSMLAIGALVFFVFMSYLLARFVFVPMYYADDKVIFWDSPAYDDFYDHEYWMDSLYAVAVFWGALGLVLLLLATCGRVLTGSWWCMRACSGGAAKEAAVAGAPSNTNIYITLGDQGSGGGPAALAATAGVAVGGSGRGGGGGTRDRVARAVSQIAAPVPFPEETADLAAKKKEEEEEAIPAFHSDRPGASNGPVVYYEMEDYGDPEVNAIIEQAVSRLVPA